MDSLEVIDEEVNRRMELALSEMKDGGDCKAGHILHAVGSKLAAPWLLNPNF
ncbi:MAG: hypothetical protein HOE90_13385 [Bacteriovoracaceae bacterium]|mgnify:CR=1 FL=1|jgi:hypothetical protein|nr:hypothetical protein [Bacteriovoracaceae bacterium]